MSVMQMGIDVLLDGSPAVGVGPQLATAAACMTKLWLLSCLVSIGMDMHDELVADALCAWRLP
jgi:hypothetical protein